MRPISYHPAPSEDNRFVPADNDVRCKWHDQYCPSMNFTLALKKTKTSSVYYNCLLVLVMSVRERKEKARCVCKENAAARRWAITPVDSRNVRKPKAGEERPYVKDKKRPGGKAKMQVCSVVRALQGRYGEVNR